MVKVRITDRGIIQEAGSGVISEVGRAQVAGSGTVSATSTLTAQQVAGILVISGTAALTQTLPRAVDCAGIPMVFRAGSAHSHVLTCSQETAGTRAFTKVSGSIGAGASGQGSALTMANIVGSSVVVMSDGVNLIVLGGSGSHTLSGL